MIPVRIFISSVQSEFERERAALRDHILEDPWMSGFFEVFLFEDTPASDQRPDMLYLEEVARCDIYVGLFGSQYGSLDQDGVSPTEREFDRATELLKHRLVYLKNIGNDARDHRMKTLIAKAQKEVVRKCFDDVEDLKRAVSESLSKFWLDLSSYSAPINNDRCRSLSEAKEVLECYEKSVGQVYEHPGTLVPFNCELDRRVIASGEVSRLIRETSENIVLSGPSGCGKSLLAGDTVLDFVRHGGVAFTAKIKTYTDSLMAVLDREVQLLNVPSTSKLLSAAQMLERSILFVVDGYNECDELRRAALTLELAALARRYNANFLFTTQVPLDRPEVLTFRTVKVPQAAMETKIAIARIAMDVEVLPQEVKHLLTAVSTGLEARLVGEVGQRLDPGGSRFALFDAYARKSLGNDAREGIRALSLVAGWLFDRLSFSLSVRDLDRLVDKEGIGSTVSRRLQSAGLLSLQGDRISFVHEMFFNAFAAEEIVRRSGSQSEAILKALNAPLHAERKDFIVGAIDEQLSLEGVLNGLSDQTSVDACLSGLCGFRAREWAEARWTRLLGQLHDEVRNICFTTDNHGFHGVAFEEQGLKAWSSLDYAFLAGLPQLMVGGRYLDEILDIVGTLDERIDEECARLDVQGQNPDPSLRSRMFEISFVFANGPTPGIAKVCAIVGNSLLRANGDALVWFLRNHLAEDRMSDGQLFLLLDLTRVLTLGRFVGMTNVIVQFLVRTLGTRWRQAPYHLALKLLEVGERCHFADEADKMALIQAIESLLPCESIWLGSSITEALQCLGAFEESELAYCTVVRRQVSHCLARPDEKTSRQLAYNIYMSQFDHPFCGAYAEVLGTLPIHNRKQLLMMAACGAKEAEFFLGILIDELASFGDPKVSEGLNRFVALPPTKSHFPQEAVDVFVTAHIALARLELPVLARPESTISHPDESMAACGAILYWINRNDLDEDERRNKCRPALSVLDRYRYSATLEVLRLCDPRSYHRSERYLKSINSSIVDYFPDKAIELCTCALSQPEELIGYFNFDKNKALDYAIRVLAEHGGNEELPALRKYFEDRHLGTHAIEAIKRIEERELTF